MKPRSDEGKDADPFIRSSLHLYVCLLCALCAFVPLWPSSFPSSCELDFRDLDVAICPIWVVVDHTWLDLQHAKIARGTLAARNLRVGHRGRGYIRGNQSTGLKGKESGDRRQEKQLR